MSNVEIIEGAICLIANMQDDRNIDNLICHAISNGYDINNYEEEDLLVGEIC